MTGGKPRPLKGPPSHMLKNTFIVRNSDSIVRNNWLWSWLSWKTFCKLQAPKSHVQKKSSKKKHFQNDSRIIFSSIFNFVVISRLKCDLKLNFSNWKFRHLKKDAPSERFWLLQLFKSQFPTLAESYVPMSG